MKSYLKISFILIVSLVLVMAQTGCQKDWLDENPLDELSEPTFWKTESDAKLALVGVYYNSTVGKLGTYSNDPLIMGAATDESSYKEAAVGDMYSGYFYASSYWPRSMWNRAYTTIFKANYFLENIEKVDMDASLKAQYIAEVKFLRAYEYWLASILWGGVPLVTKVLTIEEANSQSRSSLEEIRNFTIDELTAAANALPISRSDNEKGRIVRGAALGIKGRLLMAAERWSEAAATYKEIIDMNYHLIDPRYKTIFEEEGEYSKEIILSRNCVAGVRPNGMNQIFYHPEFFGGYTSNTFYQDVIDRYLMTDGLSIEESPLYDPDNPFDNRDPRLYATVFLPEYTVFRGVLYLAHPDYFEGAAAALMGSTGYGIKKFVTENYTGNVFSSGDDMILLRYAEVLLSYLESKLENGDNITQDLLDQTINKVRSREEVDMPPVTETNPETLREIIRNERLIEFLAEEHIRYMDIRRWGIFYEVMSRKFYGMKLTDNPDEYEKYQCETSGKYAGHYIPIDKTGTYPPGTDLIPIPQYEIDINPNLQQNPAYK